MPDAPDPGLLARIRRAARQEQFLEVIPAEAAMRRFRAALDLSPLPAERVALAQALGRVVAETIAAAADAPPFDRASVDGFALRAADSAGATEAAPRRLRLNAEVLACGVAPAIELGPGTATAISTGGVIPRGADAVVMIEQTDLGEGDAGPEVLVARPASPGQFIAHAGSDIARGETVLRAGAVITSREIGMLAAAGLGEVPVVRRPRVAVISTGDELHPPGAPLPPGGIADSNAAILCAAVAEHGGEAVPLGIFRDEEAALAEAVRRGLAAADLVVMSGGTSKGAGDVSHRILGGLGPPGILVHGVALKPGKPLCLAVVGRQPVVVLPGFPTSAVFTFQEFVVPVIRALAGLPPREETEVPARLAVRLPSELGRTEYVMVSLASAPEGAGASAPEAAGARAPEGAGTSAPEGAGASGLEGAGASGPEGAGLVAWPLPKSSGSVTAFSQADGVFAIPALDAGAEAGQAIRVRLIGGALRLPELTLIGSHCVGLDALLDLLARRGFRGRTLAVGSLGGLAAAKRGECDLAPAHLPDPRGGAYNTPFLAPGLRLVPGWRRMQGVVFRPGDARFEGQEARTAVARAAADPACLLVNRNAGSGTRILLDGILRGARPAGHANQPKSHNAVAAAVAQGRADWGVAIATVAAAHGLGVLPLAEEHYDFFLPEARADRPAVRAFLEVLVSAEGRAALSALGFVAG